MNINNSPGNDAPPDRPVSWRTFVAIELPDNLKKTLELVPRMMSRRDSEAVRWIDPASIHLTLKFLGPTDPTAIPEITERLAEAAASSGRFSIGLDKTGTYPPRGRPQVFWVGVKGETNRLRSLQGRVEGALTRAGFESEKREFDPHLTVGRLHRDVTGPADRYASRDFHSLQLPALPAFTVDAISLFRTHMDQRGATYETLAKLPLS
jgi:2'-5' RNA ligase